MLLSSFLIESKKLCCLVNFVVIKFMQTELTNDFVVTGGKRSGLKYTNVSQGWDLNSFIPAKRLHGVKTYHSH